MAEGDENITESVQIRLLRSIRVLFLILHPYYGQIVLKFVDYVMGG